MSVRKCKVGDIVVHNGYICRVDSVTRQITGQNVPSRAYMNIPDGTEFNPTLGMTPLFGPTGDPVKKPKPRSAPSGAVEFRRDEIKSLEAGIATLLKNLKALKEAK